jgi:hypothetical protein
MEPGAVATVEEFLPATKSIEIGSCMSGTCGNHHSHYGVLRPLTTVRGQDFERLIMPYWAECDFVCKHTDSAE